MKKIIFMLIILGCITKVYAQETMQPVSSGAASFLTLGTNARSMGMGGTSIALSGNAQAVFQNGATALFQSQQAAVSYTIAPVLRELESGHTLHSLGGFYTFNHRHAILAGFRYYRYPSMEVCSEFQEEHQLIRPKEWSFDMGYAYRFPCNLAISASMRLVHSDMGSWENAQKAHAVAFDFGAMYQQSFSWFYKASWSASVLLSNLGSRMEYLQEKEYLPSTMQIGGALDLSFNEKHQLILSSDLSYRLLPHEIQSIAVSIGSEYTIMKNYKLRGGYHYGDQTKADFSFATIGAGITYSGINADFSWLCASQEVPMKNSYWITIGYQF